MDADLESLVVALDRLARFLAMHGEAGWADWVAGDATRVRRGDGHGVTHFLEAFGGMGSLRDLAFSPSNGNAASDAEAALLNQAFGEILADARAEADALRHDAEA